MGKSKGDRPGIVGLVMAILILMAGCAPAFRTNPQLQEKAQFIKTVAIMSPSIKVYQLSAGGVKELMDEWTSTAQQTVARAVDAKLKGESSFVIKPLPSRSAILETERELKAESVQFELEDTQALFDAVSASIMLHTYVEGQTFPEKLKDFDYSLGPEVGSLAKLANADAILFISGVDHISTGGRKALMLLGTLVAAAAGVIVIPGGGTTALSMALVDATTGAILWYNVVGSQGGHDLRDPVSTAVLVEQVFNGFPGIRAKPSEPTRKF